MGGGDSLCSNILFQLLGPPPSQLIINYNNEEALQLLWEWYSATVLVFTDVVTALGEKCRVEIKVPFINHSVWGEGDGGFLCFYLSRPHTEMTTNGEKQWLKLDSPDGVFENYMGLIQTWNFSNAAAWQGYPHTQIPLESLTRLPVCHARTMIVHLWNLRPLPCRSSINISIFILCDKTVASFVWSISDRFQRAPVFVTVLICMCVSELCLWTKWSLCKQTKGVLLRNNSHLNT